MQAAASATLSVRVVGGACAISVDGRSYGVGNSLEQPISLGAHDITCVTGGETLGRHIEVRDFSRHHVEFTIRRDAAQPPPAPPPQPIDPRTLPQFGPR